MTMYSQFGDNQALQVPSLGGDPNWAVPFGGDWNLIRQRHGTSAVQNPESRKTRDIMHHGIGANRSGHTESTVMENEDVEMPRL